MTLKKERKDLTKKFNEISKTYKINKNSEQGILNRIARGNTNTIRNINRALDTAIKDKIAITVGSLTSIINYKDVVLPTLGTDGYNLRGIDLSKLPTITINFKPYQIDVKKGKEVVVEFGDRVLKFLQKDFNKFKLKFDKEYIVKGNRILELGKQLPNSISDVIERNIPYDDELLGSVIRWSESTDWYFKISPITKHGGISKINKNTLVKRRVRGKLLDVSNSFMAYNSNGSLLDNKIVLIDYVKNNSHSGSCLFDAIINQYYDLDKRHSVKLTYEKLFNICFPKKVYSEDLELSYSPEEVIPFFIKYGLGFHIVDITGKITTVYEPEKYNINIDPENFYILIHNNHAYQINTSIDKLKKISEEKLEASNKYYIKKWSSESIVIETYEELIKYDFSSIKNEYVSVKLLSDLNECFKMLFSKGYEPKINYDAGRITSLFFKLLIDGKEKMIYIINPNHNENEKDSGINSKNRLGIYEEYDELIYCGLICNENKSRYNELMIKMMHETYQYPLTGIFIDDYEKDDKCDAYDMCKAYTSCLLDIKEFPVFTSFDKPETYDGHEIEDLTFYLIKKNEVSKSAYTSFKIIMRDNIAGMYGYALRNIAKEAIEIVAFCRPGKKVKNNIADEVLELYDMSGLDMKYIKEIMNKNIGKLGKLKDKKSVSYVFNNEDEANYFDVLFNRTINNIDIDGNQYFIYNKVSDEKYLIDGFFPIYVLILDYMRVKMAKMFNEVIQGGGEVLGIHTDCIYTVGYNFKIDNIDKTKFNSIGKLTLEKDVVIPTGNLIVNSSKKSVIGKYVSNDIICRHKLENEFDNVEFSKYAKKFNKSLILGELPGSGKTTSIIKACKKAGFNILVICPTNNLAYDVRKEHEVNAITLNKLFGFVEGMDNLKMSKYRIEDYNCFIFDEIYFYNIGYLEYVKDFILRNGDSKYYFATGDIYQLEPVKSLTTMKYNDKCIKSIFKDCLYLSESKRFTDKEDIKKLHKIKKMLFVDGVSNIEICKKYFKKSEGMTKNDLGISYKNDTCNKVNKVVHGNGGFYPGLKVICSKWLKGFNVNDTYIIKSISGKSVVIEFDDETHELKTSVFKDHFDYPYCRTAHSMQGLTTKQNIHIFDVDFHYSNECKAWLWVCITRAKSLDSIFYSC